MKVRTGRVLLVFAALLPAVRIMAAGLAWITGQEREKLERNLRDDARALAALLDRELAASIRQLQTLATSGSLAADDLAGFHAQARRVKASAGRWDAIGIVDRRRQQLVSTLRPFGAPPRQAVAGGPADAVIRTGKPAVTDLYTSPALDRLAFAVGVPVHRDGRLEYVLVAGSSAPGFLQGLIAEMGWPSQRLVTIIDGEQRILARSRDIEKLLGRRASGTFARLAAAQVEAVWKGITLEGVPVYAAMRRSALSRWTVGVAIPQAAAEAAMRRSLLVATIGAAGMLALGAGLALAVGRAITRPLHSLAEAAAALGSGEFDRRAEVRGSHELAALGVAFNRMADRMREAQAELAASAERFRDLYENAPIPYWSIGADGIISRCNAAAATLVGARRAEDLVGRPVFDLHAPGARGRELFRRFLEGEAVQEEVIEVRRLDGTTAWVSRTMNAIRGADGRIVGSRSMMVDITARKVAGEALQRSEHHLRSILDGLGPTMFVGLLRPDGTLLEANRPALEIAGLSRGDVVGKPLTETFWFSHSSEAQRQLREAILRAAKGEACRYDVVVQAAEGRFITIDLSIHPLRDEAGQIIYLVPSARDITDRRRAEEALEARTRHLEMVREVTEDITRELDLATVLDLIVSRASQLLQGDNGGVWLWEEESQVLVPRASHGFPAEGVAGQRRRLGEGLSGTVAQRRQGLVVNDFSRSPYVLPGFTATQIVQAAVAEPLLGRGRMLGTLVVGRSRAGRPFTEQDREALAFFAAQAAIAIENARLFAQAERAAARLQALSRRLVEVQEAERAHLARELHDEIGQLLTGLKLTLHTVERLSAGTAAERVRQAQAVAGEVLARARDISLDLRPSMLDDLGLLPALAWHNERFTARTGVRVTLQQALGDRRFPPEVETAAYRIVQEALTNVARHAGVRDATVRIWATAEILGVQVEDRGKGFDPARTDPRACTGLAGMHERAALIGGTWTVESAPGQGTCVSAELPLPPLRAGAG